MHPLASALESSGVTQEQLSKLVNALRRRRRNGRRLRLAQSTISQICSFKRGTSPDIAEAISAALGGRITAAEIIFASPEGRKTRGSRAA